MSSSPSPLLPQCGFGADTDFDSLIKTNRFLFRVYTPKQKSPFADDTDPFFIAPRFDEQVNRSPVDLPNVKFSETMVGSYAEVEQHMEWTTRHSSSYISTTFSFSWAIWEAVKRYHLGVKKDVEIAVIDATRLGGRAATAVQLLNKSSPAEQTEQFWKWYRFSEDSQSVLVYGMIPRPAVLASIPLLNILRKMPSYFLRNDLQIILGNPLDQAAWDYTKRKLGYRTFCQAMGKRFLGQPAEVRLRDSTAGAVRLALSFLRPFFHRRVAEDFDDAISYLRTLAITISEWPGGVWVQEHPEARQIIEVMVLALGEELRDKYARQNAEENEEISRLQLIIDGLQHDIKSQFQYGGGSGYIVNEVDIDSDGEFEGTFDEFDEPTLVTQIEVPASMKRNGLSLETSVSILPRVPIAFQTPITPPESPRNSLFISTATAAFNGIASSQFSFTPQPPRDETAQVQGATSSLALSPVSEEPASPPPTPPSRSPVFLPLKLQNIGEGVSPHTPGDDDRLVADDTDQNAAEPAAEEPVTMNAQPDPEADTLTKEEERQLALRAYDQEDEGEETEHEEDDTHNHGQDHDDHEYYATPFPTSHSQSWVAVRRNQHLGSPFSSPRSSIMSVETLCEPNELPMKRLSLATAYSDSFEFAPTMRSLGLMSRTVSFSFSDFSPHIPPANMAQVEDIDPLSIPLPLSPALSQESLPTSLSRSSSASSASSASSTSTSSDSSPSLPLITPLPPSPVLSLGSLPSSISRTSSTLSSLLHPESPSSPTIPLAPEQMIIPPKSSISLLSPLSAQDVVQDDDNDSRRRVRAPKGGETASYLVTGFLVGAFLTLFLFSTQRRTMLYLT